MGGTIPAKAEEAPSILAGSLEPTRAGLGAKLTLIARTTSPNRLSLQLHHCVGTFKPALVVIPPLRGQDPIDFAGGGPPMPQDVANLFNRASRVQNVDRTRMSQA